MRSSGGNLDSVPRPDMVDFLLSMMLAWGIMQRCTAKFLRFFAEQLSGVETIERCLDAEHATA